MNTRTSLPSSKRPHWITGLTTLLVGATILVANLDGYHNHLFGSSTTMADDPRSANWNWSHGWPWPFMVRHSIYPLSGQYTGNSFTGPFAFNSRWPFDSAKVRVLGITPILVDIACWLALTCGTAYAAQRLTGWWSPRNSFGLRTLFVAVTLVALGIYYGPTLFEDDARFVLYYLTIAIAAAASALALFGLIDIAYRVVRRLRIMKSCLGHQI